MMSLTRRQPFGELGDLHDRLDKLFERVGDATRSPLPAIDVVREKDRVKVEAEVPGYKPEEVKITAEGGVLTISGEHEESKEEEREDEHYIRRERTYGSFRRSFALPEGADPEAITATTHDGVLEVAIPLPAGNGGPVEITPKAA